MSDDEPEQTWQDKHPVLGMVVGTLGDIEQQGKTIRKLAMAIETLDKRVRAIETQLARKKKAKISPSESKEPNPRRENDETEEPR
jgi:hypothetical protein